MFINQVLLSTCYFLGFAVMTSGIYLLVLYAQMKENNKLIAKAAMDSRNEKLTFVRFGHQRQMIDRCIVVVEDVEPYKLSYDILKLKNKHTYV